MIRSSHTSIIIIILNLITILLIVVISPYITVEGRRINIGSVQSGRVVAPTWPSLVMGSLLGLRCGAVDYLPPGQSGGKARKENNSPSLFGVS